MTTYVLTVSEFFPKTHKKSGSETNFVDKIKSSTKKHTIRSNFKLWQKRFEKIQKGEACISIRIWTGKPYASKQKEVLNLTKTDGISIEKLEFHKDRDSIPSLKYPIINNTNEPNIDVIAANDGLSLDDFKEWFKSYDLSETMVIIHFTNFKYSLTTWIQRGNF